MKRSELTCLLDMLDEDEDSEIIVNGHPIFSMAKNPSFAEGCLEKYEFEEGELVGAELSSEGSKINLIPLALSDALIMNPDLPIKKNIHNNVLLMFYEKKLNAWLVKARKLHSSFTSALQNQQPNDL